MSASNREYREDPALSRSKNVAISEMADAEDLLHSVELRVSEIYSRAIPVFRNHAEGEKILSKIVVTMHRSQIALSKAQLALGECSNLETGKFIEVRD
ncbi:hypothetical protein [Glutamicibacter ardleyensis]|uniref:hypothetical protein n=1 Tax=Glutamicibacter ardleyensis TaxID=225894 RepID=UPI003FD042FE